MNNILMHGPAFDEKGELVERNVPKVDVVAFQNAGYTVGPIPDHLKLQAELKAKIEEAKAAEEPKKTKAKG